MHNNLLIPVAFKLLAFSIRTTPTFALGLRSGSMTGPQTSSRTSTTAASSMTTGVMSHYKSQQKSTQCKGQTDRLS
ncbi:kinesin-like protein KIN-14O [Iris pallida]|uniref:Kinesin-like protein KIN-14O n=1 Tax=Iris pallida TaxID=29817 RepID=A0AAX6H722_IRIPA|nr:kinesin-like protein KIN-14O [Iris pallida]